MKHVNKDCLDCVVYSLYSFETLVRKVSEFAFLCPIKMTGIF